MKISVAQMNISWLNPEQNKTKLLDFFKKAVGFGAEIVIFPEMTFTGFCMDSQKALELNSGILDFVKAACRTHNIGCVFGYIQNSGKNSIKPQNCCISISKEGAVVSDYAKIHPFSFSGENNYYMPGDRIAIFDMGGLKFSTFICYDLRFPEIFQAVSNEADVLIIIANWPQARISHWDILLRARAIENQCYVIGCNRVGEGGGQNYTGSSSIVSPDGEFLCNEKDIETLLVYDVNKNQVEEYRNLFKLKQDRRTELYVKLYEKGD